MWWGIAEHVVVQCHNLLPENLNNRYSWLFSSWPILLSGERRNANEYQLNIKAERLAALIKIHEVAGIDSILDLIPNIENPRGVGISLAESGLLSENKENERWGHFFGT